VVEGQVALMSGMDRDGRLPTLVAADRLVITAEGPGVARHGVDVAAAISWTQRQLVFEHRPLGEVAEEFNRYNHDRIEIGSDALRQEQITGTFQSNDAASFVSFLANIPGVRIENDGRGGHVVTLDAEAAGK
jgi:transmembrane sensor